MTTQDRPRSWEPATYQGSRAGLGCGTGLSAIESRHCWGETDIRRTQSFTVKPLKPNSHFIQQPPYRGRMVRCSVLSNKAIVRCHGVRRCCGERNKNDSNSEDNHSTEPLGSLKPLHKAAAGSRTNQALRGNGGLSSSRAIKFDIQIVKKITF